MKIGIVALDTPSCGGMYQYTQQLIQSLLDHTVHEYIIFRHPQFTVSGLRGSFKEMEVRIESDPVVRMKRLACAYLPFLKKRIHIAPVYRMIEEYGLDALIDPMVSSVPVFVNVPAVAVLHDLQHKYYPGFFRLNERKRRDCLYSAIIKNAKVVVCESRFVKNDLIAHYKTPQEKIVIVQSPPPHYLPGSISSQRLHEVKVKYGLPDRFLMYPAQFLPHKNHANLIKAIYKIYAKHGERVPLVFMGAQKMSFETIMKEVKGLGLSRQVTYLGYVPEGEKFCLYRLATALVMPTFFESISIPIWEAFMSGTPVLSSTVCALPEQVGNAGMLFDAHNVDDIAEKIWDIWNDQKLRETLVAKGRDRIRDLTSSQYAAHWDGVLRKAAG